MRKRDKRDVKDLALRFWSDYWDLFPYYKHEQVFSFIINRNHRFMLNKPKIKRGVLHPKELNLYSSCPKDWNKIYHIRPIRRANKNLTDKSVGASRLEDFTFVEDWAYRAEERFYPSYKRHVYYW